MKITRHTQQHASDWERRHLVGTLRRQLPWSHNLQIHAPSKVSALLRLLPQTHNNALLAPPKVAALLRQLPRTHNNAMPTPPKVGPLARQLYPDAPRTFIPGTAIGLKGQRPALITAQGNALGIETIKNQALKGRPKPLRSFPNEPPLQGLDYNLSKTQNVALGCNESGRCPSNPTTDYTDSTDDFQTAQPSSVKSVQSVV